MTKANIHQTQKHKPAATKWTHRRMRILNDICFGLWALSSKRKSYSNSLRSTVILQSSSCSLYRQGELDQTLAQNCWIWIFESKNLLMQQIVTIFWMSVFYSFTGKQGKSSSFFCFEANSHLVPLWPTQHKRHLPIPVTWWLGLTNINYVLCWIWPESLCVDERQGVEARIFIPSKAASAKQKTQFWDSKNWTSIFLYLLRSWSWRLFLLIQLSSYHLRSFWLACSNFTFPESSTHFNPSLSSCLVQIKP